MNVSSSSALAGRSHVSQFVVKEQLDLVITHIAPALSCSLAITWRFSSRFFDHMKCAHGHP